MEITLSSARQRLWAASLPRTVSKHGEGGTMTKAFTCLPNAVRDATLVEGVQLWTAGKVEIYAPH
jgi:hypothetical protein